MQRVAIVVLSIIIAGGPRLGIAADPADLDTKEIFTGGLPQGLAFRGEMRGADHLNYAAWEASVIDQSGVIQKFMPEELPKINPQSAAWAEQYVQAHPEKLVLLHLNLESRHLDTDPAVTRRYFPGDWVYEPGSMLTTSVTSDATELGVANMAPFKVKAYRDHRHDKGPPTWLPQMLCLVTVDEHGHRDWYQSEYVIVTGVDPARKTISVRRAQLFSTAMPHAAGRTYVAPMAAGVWGGSPMGFYNLSSACPKDRQGHDAADVFSGEIAEWFAPGGPLEHLNGIAGDVNYWVPSEQNWDVNNDGQPDGGIVNGVNLWRLGDYKFLSEVRRAVGEGRLISSDGEFPGNQQEVGVMDGIESEGLVEPSDGFRGISRTINTHLYWLENTPRPHDFRYVVLKLENPADAKRGDQLRRLAIGTACCLGARTTAIPAGLLPPAFAAPGSLGVPVGPMLRPVRDTPDLLHGAGLAAPLVAQGCTLTRAADRIEISPGAGSGPMVVTLKNLAVPAGDLTVFAEMQALDPMEGFGADTFVPRRVDVAFSKLPNYGEGRYDSYYSSLYGFIGTHRRSVMAFYLRRPQLPTQTLDVSFTIEGRGRACLYGLTAYGGADTLVRAFTHGVVAVNPSLQPLTISLRGAAPAGSSLPPSVQVPALDAVFLPKG